MRPLRALRRWLPALVLPLLFAGCAVRPPPAPPVVAAAPAAPEGASSAVPAYEQAQRFAAEAAARDGRWADAVWAWDIVLAIAPKDTAAHQRRQAAQAQVQALLAERLASAREARAGGQMDQASRLYLDALALSPGQLEAANALRAIERDRARRQAVGGFARPMVPPEAARSEAQRRTTSRQLDLEHASLLAGQGDIDAAIALLLPIPAKPPASQATRKLLAELLLQRADKLADSDREAAISDLRQSLRLQPQHTQARARLQSLLGQTPSAAAPKKAAPREPVSKPSSGPASGR